MSFILKILGGPSGLTVMIILAGVLLGIGGVTGWKTRDYFADRKELAALKAEVKSEKALTARWESSSRDFEKQMNEQAARAAALTAQRAESETRAGQLARLVQSYKAKLTTLEKPDVENGGMCERTAECHWLLFNAAVTGASAPAQCTGSVSNSVPR